jgi:hypothetical protein
MSENGSAGARFRSAVAEEQPLQVVGTITAYAARMAERTGFRAIYLSGGGVAANSLGMPDLGISTMEDVLIDIRRITDVCGLPLLVDVDTGWGGAFNIARTVRAILNAPPHPVSTSTSRGKPHASVMRRISTSTSSIVLMPRSGMPSEFAATPPPDR